jgi:N-acetylglucosamine-6-phosphate deacetylase
MSTQFFAEKVFTGTDALFNQIIVVENGRIRSVESGTP